MFNKSISWTEACDSDPATRTRPGVATSSLFKTEGAGKAGCRYAPAASCAKRKSTRAKSPQVRSGNPAFPARMVLTVSFVLSPVIGLSCHRHRRDEKHRRQLDASVEASRPHDFTVRGKRHSSFDSATAIASRPNIRDDREAPLFMGTGRQTLYCCFSRFVKRNIFCRRTRQ